MNAGTLTRSMLAMTVLAPFALGCDGPTDLPDPAAGGDNGLRIAGDPGDPPPPPPPWPALPLSSDLKPDGTMRFYAAGASIGVQLNVVNVGNIPATAPSGMVNIGGYNAGGALYQYWGGTATTPNTVNPGQRGYIMVYLPAGTLADCKSYLTHIDTTRVMQTSSGGAPDPALNDEANVATQCIGWTTPITGDNFSISDPLINNKTLMQIVSSQTVARKDGKLCSNCHFSGCGLGYCPPVAKDSSAPIWPTDVINGRTWAGPTGYSRTFLMQPTDMPQFLNSKPFYLKQLVQTWINDGERSPPSILADPGPFVAF
jgi:hypothetical protein